jgi:hypothetical protein
MPNLGHFPMSENPELFLEYIRPVLADIASASNVVSATDAALRA